MDPKQAFEDLIQATLNELPAKFKEQKDAIASYASEQSLQLATILDNGEPGFDKAVIAARNNVALFAGLGSAEIVKSTQQIWLGVLAGGLRIVAVALASAGGSAGVVGGAAASAAAEVVDPTPDPTPDTATDAGGEPADASTPVGEGVPETDGTDRTAATTPPAGDGGEGVPETDGTDRTAAAAPPEEATANTGPPDSEGGANDPPLNPST
tara:strand:- start:3253 stop:3885 length:633 start_codon:yes stop_codon:yes gene_type:complete